MKRLLFLFLFAFSLFGIDAVSAANRFAVCVTTCTWDNSSTTMWSTTTGGATGASAPVATDDAILDAATCVGGVTCTITVNAALNVNSITMGACTASTTGCILDFSVNNNSPTIQTNFSLTGTGTRNLKLGSGTFTFATTQSLTAWDSGTITNLTFNAGTSTLAFTGSPAGTNSEIFSGSTLTYNNITIAAAVGTFQFSGAATFNAITVTGLRYLVTGASLTITTLNMNGTSGNVVTFANNNVTVQRTLTVTTLNATWAAFRAISFGSALTATNCTDLGYNTNLTCTVPSGGAAIPHLIGGGL